MKRIEIQNNNENIIIDLDNNNIDAIRFNKNNEIEKLTNITNYFEFLKMSDDYKEETSNNEYIVYYDNKTKLRHYFKNKEEDYLMFYNNNGYDMSEQKNMEKSIRLNDSINTIVVYDYESLLALINYLKRDES